MNIKYKIINERINLMVESDSNEEDAIVFKWYNQLIKSLGNINFVEVKK